MKKEEKRMNKVYYTDKNVESWVHTILRDMNGWRPDYVVGITRGGLTPALLISNYLDIPMHTLKVTFREGDEYNESNCWMAEDAFGYVTKEDRGDTVVWSDIEKRKNILIVDDINDTGRTIQWIKDDWQSSCIPSAEDLWNGVWNANVRFAVLINNEASEFTEVDYAGLLINKNEKPQWAVFPWEEWWTK